MKKLGLVFTFIIFASFGAWAQDMTAGIHLVTYKPLGFTVDGTQQGIKVRGIIDQAKELGFKTLILNVRAHMVTGVGNDIKSVIPLNLQAREEVLIEDTARYAKSKGLKVALRPIVLVVGPNGEFPYVSKGVYWWHGNIKPTNIDRWFENLYDFHHRYLKLAMRIDAEWYSVGAEMHSMTSGFGERDKTWSLGFPGKWVEFMKKARAIVGDKIKLTYGLNYTDQYIVVNGIKVWGGELEQWRYFMLSDFNTEKYQKHQADLRELWSQFDIIGIDYYRALAGRSQNFSTDHNTLVGQLLDRPRSHADQLDSFVTEVSITLGQDKPFYFQEVGYRSSARSFLNPSAYEDEGGPYNPLHQAAAWDAFFKSYWEVKWPWMSGVGVWQILVDEEINQTNNTGFTPLGKPQFQNILKKYLK